MKKYRWIQGIAAAYGVIYVAALYYASGVHTGFKLDDHQLTGYVICGLLLGCLVGSFLVRTRGLRRLLALVLLGCCLALLGVTLFDIVNFNEAFWYFIFWVYLLPIMELIETIEFIIETRTR